MVCVNGTIYIICGITVLGSLYLKLHKTLVNLQIEKLISNKMRICSCLTRCTRLGREIYTNLCEESSVSNISEEHTAFWERWTSHVDRKSYDR